MQSYFNQDDAWIEVDEVLNGNSHEKYNGSEFIADAVSGRMKFAILASLLVAMVMMLGTNLSSSVPPIAIDEDKEVIVEHTFIVEIPEPEPVKIKPPPKKKVVEPPKDRKPPTRRKMPEQYASVMAADVEPRRDVVKDLKREQVTEEAMVREIPQIQTPVIERSDLAVREKVSDKVRQVSAVVAASDTVRQYSYADIEVRNAPTALVSHSQLDPYHYQMVDICLRLCMQSIFPRESIGSISKDYNNGWLRVEKSAGQNNLLFKHQGQWLDFSINTDRLKVLSDISFFEVPTSLSSSGELDNVVENITRRLCDLLNHDECLENL